MRLEPRDHASPLLSIAVSTGALAVTLGFAAILVALSGAPILHAFGLMFSGALGSGFAINETLTRATPLIFTGLAAAIAFRARLWNIGAEGQLYMGAVAATMLSFSA